MAPQYQQPRDPGEAIRARWASSLDGIYEQYVASKAAIEKARGASTDSMLQYGFDKSKLTPEIISQASQPAPVATPGVMALPSPLPPRPGMDMTAPQDPRAFAAGLASQPVDQQAQPAAEEHPIVGHVRSYLAKRDLAEKTAQDATRAGTLEKTAHATKDIADANLADRKPFDVQLSEKANQFNTKRFTQLGDALDPSKARAGAFGTSKQVFDRAERLQTLASAYRDNNLDSRQVEELAIGLNSMLSGSNVGAASQVEKLVPKSIMGDAQKLKEWIANDPKGTNQQEFVKRMLGSIDREKSTASDQIKRTQFERIARYGDLEKADADEFANVLQSAGVDPEEYRAFKKGGYKRASAVQGAEGGSKGGDPLGIR